jgi:hypothetical protein
MCRAWQIQGIRGKGNYLMAKMIKSSLSRSEASNVNRVSPEGKHFRHHNRHQNTGQGRYM